VVLAIIRAFMAQIYLFTGENAFLLREERRRWTAEFAKKYGEENCAVIDGPKANVRSLLDEISVMPFLAEKRLVIVEGIPKCTKEDIQTLEAQIHPQVLLLFVDPKIDKRTAGAKELLKTADVKEFTELKGPVLLSWMHTFAQAQSATFAPKAAEMLMEFIGEDQDQIAQEIYKLALHANGEKITAEDVDLMVIPTDEGVIWKISDLLGAGDKPGALRYAKRLIDRGGDAYGLWAIMLNMLKNLIAVSAAMDAGNHSSKDIADVTGVHIFAVRSLQTHAKRASQQKIASFLSWAADTDRDLKTGVYRSTDEAPQELRALIDRFILSCP
jgi:DNA polymerase-3 subunit delta